MATIVQDNNNSAQNSKENDSFIIEEYKTIREEITATKSRLFLITGIGIAAIPVLLNWVNGVERKDIYLIALEAAIPFFIISALFIFISENRNLMRCGRYIRKCIEPSLVNKEIYPDHIGWESWLESSDIQGRILNKKEEKTISCIRRLPHWFPGRDVLLDNKNFENRAVDRLLVQSFMTIFIFYYLLSSAIAVISIDNFIFKFISIAVYIYSGIYFGIYFFLHYNDLVSTKDDDDITKVIPDECKN